MPEMKNNSKAKVWASPVSFQLVGECQLTLACSSLKNRNNVLNTAIACFPAWFSMAAAYITKNFSACQAVLETGP